MYCQIDLKRSCTNLHIFPSGNGSAYFKTCSPTLSIIFKKYLLWIDSSVTFKADVMQELWHRHIVLAWVVKNSWAHAHELFSNEMSEQSVQNTLYLGVGSDFNKTVCACVFRMNTTHRWTLGKLHEKVFHLTDGETEISTNQGKKNFLWISQLVRKTA